MQIIGSGQIVTSLHLLYQHFFAALRFLSFHFAFRFIILLALSECAGEFRLCGGDHGLCPLDSHKPLIKAKPVFAVAQTFLRKASRLDRNFKCFGAVTFAWFIELCAVLTPRLLSLGSHLTWARLNKKTIKNKNPASPQIIPQGRRIYLKI